MEKIEALQVLTIDGVPHLVSEMSDQVRSLVKTADHWRQKEAEARDGLLMTQAAVRDVFREIAAQIRREREEAAANDSAPAADASAPTAPAAVPTPTPVDSAPTPPAGN